jgi:membrane-associated phospholipid phosphatase
MSYKNVFLDKCFIVIDNSAVYIAFGVPLLLFVISIFRRNIIMHAKAWIIISSLFCSVIATETFKYIINGIHIFNMHSLIRTGEGGNPSFHSSDAFALSLCLCFMWPRWYVVLVSYSWALLVAYSEVGLKVHYPNEVFAGAFVGTVSAIAICIYFKSKIKDIIISEGNLKSTSHNTYDSDKKK